MTSIAYDRNHHFTVFLVVAEDALETVREVIEVFALGDLALHDLGLHHSCVQLVTHVEAHGPLSVCIEEILTCLGSDRLVRVIPRIRLRSLVLRNRSACALSSVEQVEFGVGAFLVDEAGVVVVVLGGHHVLVVSYSAKHKQQLQYKQTIILTSRPQRLNAADCSDCNDCTYRNV